MTDYSVASISTGITLNSGDNLFILSGGVAQGTTVNSGGHEYVSSGGMAGGTLVSGGVEIVYGGGEASGTTVNNGYEIVSSGGVGISATLNSGGEQDLYGTADGTAVDSGGVAIVFAGGIAQQTTISIGGLEIVSAGGVASGTVINGGVESVASGGMASGTTVNAGYEVVSLGGIVSGATLGDGGEQDLYGTADGTTVDSGGVAIVFAGGIAQQTTISIGGLEIVSSGGVASGTVINGGVESVASGGMASGTTVNAGYEVVSLGGIVSGATLGDGGEQDLYGTADGTTVDSGGVAIVFAGGVASGTTVSNGGHEFVSSGGLASGTVINGGVESVYAGGIADGATVNSGYDVVSSGGVDSGATINNGGEQDVYGTASGAAISGGGLQIVYAGGVVDGTTVTAGGTLELDGSSATLSGGLGITLTGGTILGSGGFSPGTTISGYGIVSISPNSDAVTATGGTLEFTVAIATGSTFEIGNVATTVLKFDGAVGTSLLFPTIAFDGGDGGTGVLELTPTALANFHGIVSGFDEGDGIKISGAASASLVSSTQLAVYDGSGAQLGVIALATSYAGDTFNVGNGVITVNDLVATLAGLTNGHAIAGTAVNVSSVLDDESAVSAGLTYQWLLDGNPISGQTGSSYTPTAAESGHALSVAVTYSSDGASGESTVGSAGTVFPPAPAVLALAVASDQGVQGDTLTVGGTGQAGASVTLLDGTSMVGTGVVGLNGTWSIATIALGAGGHNLTATETAGGATSDPSAIRQLIVTLGTPNSVTFYGTPGTDLFTGGAGNDVFMFSATNLTGADSVNGNGGIDTLRMTTAGTIVASGVKGTEIYLLASAGPNRVVLTNANFASVAGASIQVVGGNAGNIVNASAVTGLNQLVYTGGAGVDQVTGGGGNDVFVFSAANLKAADSIAGGGGSDTLRMTTAGTVAVNGVGGVETYLLASTGANSLTLKNNNFADTGKTIQVVGGAAGNTVNASAVNSRNGMVFTGGAGVDHVIGGAGNDVFAFSAADLTAADSVVGGGGSDTLRIMTAGAVNAGGVSGVETYLLSSAGANNLALTNANFVKVSGGSIHVVGSSAGNIVNASAVTGTNRLVFTGGAGGDTILAGSVAVMTGAGGANQFTFSDIGIHTITDFASSASNALVLRDAKFNLGFDQGLGTSSLQHLDSSVFVSNGTGAFTTKSQRFAYNTTTGNLLYDPDGSGSTFGAHPVAVLSDHASLSAGTAGNLFFVL